MISNDFFLFPGQLLCEWEIFKTETNNTVIFVEGKRSNRNRQDNNEKEKCQWNC